MRQRAAFTEGKEESEDAEKPVARMVDSLKKQKMTNVNVCNTAYSREVYCKEKSIMSNGADN